MIPKKNESFKQSIHGISHSIEREKRQIFVLQREIQTSVKECELKIIAKESLTDCLASNSTQCTLNAFNALFTIYCSLYTVQYILYNTYSILYSIITYILYIILILYLY